MIQRLKISSAMRAWCRSTFVPAEPIRSSMISPAVVVAPEFDETATVKSVTVDPLLVNETIPVKSHDPGWSVTWAKFVHTPEEPALVNTAVAELA